MVKHTSVLGAKSIKLGPADCQYIHHWVPLEQVLYTGLMTHPTKFKLFIVDC
jgi:hypothetical protein